MKAGWAPAAPAAVAVKTSSTFSKTAGPRRRFARDEFSCVPIDRPKCRDAALELESSMHRSCLLLLIVLAAACGCGRRR
jgi:hypothetical protein